MRWLLAFVAVVGCGKANDVDQTRKGSEEAYRAQEKALRQAAEQRLTQARDEALRLGLQLKLDDVSRNIDAANRAVASARTDAERDAAKAKVAQLNQQRLDLENELAAGPVDAGVTGVDGTAGSTSPIEAP